MRISYFCAYGLEHSIISIPRHVLTCSIYSFRKHLKTHFLNIAFSLATAFTLSPLKIYNGDFQEATESRTLWARRSYPDA